MTRKAARPEHRVSAYTRESSARKSGKRKPEPDLNTLPDCKMKPHPGLKGKPDPVVYGPGVRTAHDQVYTYPHVSTASAWIYGINMKYLYLVSQGFISKICVSIRFNRQRIANIRYLYSSCKRKCGGIRGIRGRSPGWASRSHAPRDQLFPESTPSLLAQNAVNLYV